MFPANPHKQLLRYVALTIVVLMVLIGGSIRLSPGVAADPAIVSTATREGRLTVFDDVWQTLRDRYYDPAFHGVDWISQRSLLRVPAADARDANQFYSILRRLIAPLKDSHTRVYAPQEKFDWQHPRYISVGISLREIEGQPVVVDVQHGSEAEHAGLRRGDLIESIDGEEALAKFHRRLQDDLGSSTPQAARLRALATLIEGEPETTVDITWKDEKGESQRATLKRTWRERPLTLHVRHRSKVDVITLDAFTRPIATEFQSIFANLKRQPRGIVFDLRSNGGGDAGVMSQIASVFLPPATSIGSFTDRSGIVTLTLETDPLSTSRLRPPLSVVVLTSERTSSAAEILTDALRTRHAAAVVGSQTCGCVLAIRSHHALPDGGQLDISELDYRNMNGVRLEGHGIVPDEQVTLTRRDLYSGRDRALETAIAKLKSSKALNSPK